MIDAEDPEAVIALAMQRLRLKTHSHIEAWGLDKARWEVDLDEGVISFISPGLLVVASVQLIGSYDYADGSWWWGWDHPSAPEPQRRDARLVRDFGERHGLSRYVSFEINCTEDEAWEFTALACHLAEASGAYRGQSGSAGVFLTFHEPKIRGRLPPASP